MSWQFLKSGWLKLTSWETTVELFRSEYQVPVLSPAIAALAGTARTSGTMGVVQNRPILTPGVANVADSTATARSQAATS